jgi:hypothetical protein
VAPYFPRGAGRSLSPSGFASRRESRCPRRRPKQLVRIRPALEASADEQPPLVLLVRTSSDAAHDGIRDGPEVFESLSRVTAAQ